MDWNTILAYCLITAGEVGFIMLFGLIAVIVYAIYISSKHEDAEPLSIIMGVGIGLIILVIACICLIVMG